MFIICDKNPEKAAMYLAEKAPKSLIIKQMNDICIMAHQAGISNAFKIPFINTEHRNKKQVEWIKKYPIFTKKYFDTLLKILTKKTIIKDETYGRYLLVSQDFAISRILNKKSRLNPKTIVFQRNANFEPKKFSTKEIEKPLQKGIELNIRYLDWLIDYKRKLIIFNMGKCLETLEKKHKRVKGVDWRDITPLICRIKDLLNDEFNRVVPLTYPFNCNNIFLD